MELCVVILSCLKQGIAKNSERHFWPQAKSLSLNQFVIQVVRYKLSIFLILPENPELWQINGFTDIEKTMIIIGKVTKVQQCAMKAIGSETQQQMLSKSYNFLTRTISVT